MSHIPTIELDTVLIQNKEVLSAAIDDSLVLMSFESENYYGLEAISRRIWELFAEPCAVTTICAQLLSEYDVDVATCEQEVLAFVYNLAKQKLIQVVTR